MYWLLLLIMMVPQLQAQEADAAAEEFVVPQITINGQVVQSEGTAGKMAADHLLTPDSLRSPEFRSKLKNKVNITPFAHSPQIGKSFAPIEIIEFLDLSCAAECAVIMERLAQLQERHPKKIRFINIYMPSESVLNMVNFYGKIAQKAGVFWEFREAILAQNITQSQAALEILLGLDVSRDQIRLATRRDAGDVYRQLDQERLLAEKLRLGTPPHLFINGIHVGDGGIPLANLEDVILYTLMEMKRTGAKF